MQNNSIEHEICQNSLEYGVAVNTDRAIPDAKSGLKPVARRVLYDAFVTNRASNKPHVKCADIVGTTMSRFHPHGDSSIYGALVRLTQDWVMRYPLLDPHGNFGNIFGDGPASQRYTEVRLSKLAEDGLLKNLKKNVVDFTPNYSETEDEPITLPAIFPNLLCNPNEGIGWAIGCSWAPHNLNEVAQAIHDYVDGIEPMLPGPDFPTGGIVINKNDIPKIMQTGHGSVKIRGRYKIEGQNIVFYELPYGTKLEDLMTQIGKASEEEKLSHIADVRNESGRKGIRLTIQVDKNADPNKIVNDLFAKTDLQTSFSYNQIALIGKTPTEMNLKDAIKVYVDHNLDCNKREKEFDLNKIQARQEIVAGLLIALEDIDNVIAIIKKSKDTASAIQNLLSHYNLTENQAKAIVDMKLGRLAGLEKIALQEEKTSLEKEAADILSFLNSESQQTSYMLEKLDTIVKKYGDARRTELTQIEINPEEKEIAAVAPENVVVIVSQNGDIKRIPSKSFKVQRRNGKGVKSIDDAVLASISTNTIDTLMVFTSKGKMYRLLVDNVPAGTNTSKGTNLNSLIKFEDNEKVIAVTSLNHGSQAKYAVFFTKKGLIKKTYIEEYTKVKRNNGIVAISLKDNDTIANVCFLDEEEVLVITKKGMSIHFDTASINPIGRATAGVKSIKLIDDDEVVIGLPLYNETDDVAVFTEKGFGKKVSLSEFPYQQRGGKGNIVYKPNPTTGDIVGAALVNDRDSILLVGIKSICIAATDLPLLTRISMGNIMIKNTVKSIVKL
jgi:DNA gyrase subunit A